MIPALLLLGMFVALAAVAYWFSRDKTAGKAELKQVSTRSKQSDPGGPK